MTRLVPTGLACLALLLGGPLSLRAEDLLMYGPSLAVYIQDNALNACDFRGAHPEHGGVRGDYFEDESHFAENAGHNVTIVDATEWANMTTEQFAAYDAIVIGDAGCDCDDGDLLEPLNDNKEVWSPAVTGHLFLHTFDPIYHYTFDNPRGSSPTQLDAMVDLSVDGIEHAASAQGTGLYYAHSCRDFGLERTRGGGPLPFLSELATVQPTYQSSGDIVEIVAPGHPSMANLSDEGLSDWGSSYHDYFVSYDDFLNLLAYGSGDEVLKERGSDEGDVIIATAVPLGSAASVLPIPTANPATLGALALLLAALGAYVLHRRS